MQKEKILSLLRLIEQNSGLSELDLSIMLDVETQAIHDAISALEKEGVICGYHTLIHWDSIASFSGMKERTIVINGFSKNFAMTGWRLGYAMGNAEIISQMVKVHQYAIMCAPTISQYAAVEALQNGEEDICNMRESYNQRRRYLYHELSRLELPCFLPEGAFYMFPDIRKFGMTSEEFAIDLLNKAKVAVVPGNAFGDCGEGFIRISYAYSISELKEAVRRIENYIMGKHITEL